MKVLKESWSLFLIVAALFFLPEENLSFWFSERPQDWYGELVLQDEGERYVIIKNASSRPVELRQQQAAVLARRKMDDTSLLPPNTPTVVPEESYAIARMGQAAGPAPSARAFVQSASEFEASGLLVSTEAEDDTSILLLFVAAMLIAALSFSIGLFCHEGRPLLPDDN